MKIKNRSWSPLVVSLPGGKSLTVPGRGIEDVSAEDFESAALQRLSKSRTIVVLPDANDATADAGGDAPQPAADTPDRGAAGGAVAERAATGGAATERNVTGGGGAGSGTTAGSQ